MVFVYEHRCGLELIYIGKGTKRRAFDLSHRTKHWRSVVDWRRVTVNLLQSFDSELAARGYECELITALQPPANRYQSRYYAQALARHPLDATPPSRLARALAHAKPQA
jgi:hypothetical protein